MSLYRNKYRIETARLPGYDYSFPGMYFVTICTKGMVCYFGEIINGEMKLNNNGKIVADEFRHIARVRADVELDEWNIMPNHVHAIIVIVNGRDDPPSFSNAIKCNKKETISINDVHRKRGVVSAKSTTLQPDSLSSMIGQIKSNTTRRIHTIGCSDFAWQPRFYDHIIRTEKSLQKIRSYIQNNPVKWEEEKNELHLPPKNSW